MQFVSSLGSYFHRTQVTPQTYELDDLIQKTFDRSEDQAVPFFKDLVNFGALSRIKPGESQKNDQNARIVKTLQAIPTRTHEEMVKDILTLKAKSAGFTAVEAAECIKCYIACGGSLKTFARIFEKTLQDRASSGELDVFPYVLRFANAIYEKENMFVKGTSTYASATLWQRVSFFVSNLFFVLWFKDSDLVMAKKVLDRVIKAEAKKDPENYLADNFSMIISKVEEFIGCNINDPKREEAKLYIPLLLVLLRNGAIADHPTYLAALACKVGDEESVRILIESGQCTIYANYNDPKNALLSLACNAENPSLSFITYLLDKGADPNVCLSDDFNCMTGRICKEANRTPILDLLLSRGADVNRSDVSNESIPLISKAAKHLQLENVEVLLKHGALVNRPGKKNKTALHKLFLNTDKDGKRLPILSLLLKHGGDLKVRDDAGTTPVNYAIEVKDTLCLKEIFKRDSCLMKVLNPTTQTKTNDQIIKEFDQLIESYESNTGPLVQSVGQKRAVEIAKILGNDDLLKALSPPVGS